MSSSSSEALVYLTLYIHPSPWASLLIISGAVVSDWLTSAISPLTGQYRSLAALTDSMTPQSAPLSNVLPTPGSSTKVMSPRAS